MIKLGLIGNPNSGKSSIFNSLTGLKQTVGNYPGVTVDIKLGSLDLNDQTTIQLLDFPGAYSLHSNTTDEFLMTRALIDRSDPFHPDAILYIADVQFLDKQLLLLTQIRDLGFPVSVCLSNCDQMEEKEILIRKLLIEEKFNCNVLDVSVKTGHNITVLKASIKEFIKSISSNKEHKQPYYTCPQDIADQFQATDLFPSPYSAYLWKHYGNRIRKENNLAGAYSRETSLKLQIEETMERYSIIEPWFFAMNNFSHQSEITEKIDRWITRPVLGAVLFVFLMILIFQAIFSWASYPMDLIENSFAWLQVYLGNVLPKNCLSDLIIQGLLPGLSGVMVFIPQIAILFFLISWMEESGYMARVVYLFDHLLCKFGLNGRSLIGLISGGACAIPAIMSTRTINNTRDRLVTMFVIPLIPCSARIPVYTVLIGFLVPYENYIWIFNSQGLAFMAIYFLGITMALATAALIRYFIRSDDLSLLALQLPHYRWPKLREVLFNVYDKVKSFVLQAGGVILLISVVLWFLASFSWSGELDRIEAEVRQQSALTGLSIEHTDEMVAAKRLEYSFAGKIGKGIEPLFEPLGFDWKVSIALITSFAAREVFVGTLSTIYSLGTQDDEVLLREKMAQELRQDGSRYYDRRTSASLILFYAFAMQCMSTMAVMYKETKSKKWPIIQFAYMGVLAYLASWLAFHCF